MASGKAHATASLLLAAPCVIAVTAYTRDPQAGIAAGAGCLAGLLLSPDLDQEGLSAMEWALIKRTFGLGFLWLLAWWPYAVMLPHRCFLSHAPIIGTLIRLVYLCLPPLLLALTLGAGLPVLSITMWWLAGWGIAGLAVSDTAHWIMDLG